MVTKKSTIVKPAIKAISKVGSKKPTNEVDNLINRILKKQCETVFNSHENNDTIFVSTCNAIENSLKHYLGNQSKSIDFESMRLITIIDTVNSIKPFPKDFIGFFTTVRMKSNKRHKEMEAAKDINLLILKLEFYKFIKWFVCSYLKRDEIETAKNWYASFVNKSPVVATTSAPAQPKVIFEKDSDTDEVEKLNAKIKHQQKVIEGLMKSEKEKVQEINNLKKQTS